MRQEKTLLGEATLDLKPLLHHLLSFSNTGKLISQSLRFVKSANFSNLDEAPGRYNVRDTSDTTVGRLSLSLLLITKNTPALI